MLQDGQVHGVMALIPNAERAKYSTASPHLMYSMLAHAGSPRNPPLEGRTSSTNGRLVSSAHRSAGSSVAAQHKAKASGMQLLDEVSNETLIRKTPGALWTTRRHFWRLDVLAFVAAHEGVD